MADTVKDDGMDYSLWLSKLIRLSIGLTLVVIILGAYTRISDAGLGCPDWPGCYGQLSVPMKNAEIMRASELFPGHTIDPYKAWLEMIHRYVAGTLGLLIAAILFISFKIPELSKRWPIGLAALVIFQAALGMWTVTLKLLPIVVLLHLLGGFTLLSLLLVFGLIHHAHREQPIHSQGECHPTFRLLAWQVSSLCRLGWIAFVVLIMQIALGGWTSSNYAALVCTNFPFCEGEWWKAINLGGAFTVFQYPLLTNGESFEFGVLDYGSRMTIHMLHRVGAVVTVFTLFYFAWRLLRFRLPSKLHYSAYSLIGLVVLQVCLGIANVVMHLPVILAVSHNFVAALLLLNVVFIKVYLRLYYRWKAPNSKCFEPVM